MDNDFQCQQSIRTGIFERQPSDPNKVVYISLKEQFGIM